MTNTNTTYLFVVPCGANKLGWSAPARELYTGSYFREVLAAAELEAAATTDELGIDTRVMILSAAHGLVDPDTVLAPYDITMTDSGSVTVSELADQLADLVVDDLEVYAFLPRAYHDRLRAAADRAFEAELVDDLVLVHDVYEAAPGIGYQKAVAANLRKLPTTPKGPEMTVNTLREDETGTVFTITDAETTLGELMTCSTDFTVPAGLAITVSVLGLDWSAVAIPGAGVAWTTEYCGMRWFLLAPEDYRGVQPTTWTLTSEVEIGVEIEREFANAAIVRASRLFVWGEVAA